MTRITIPMNTWSRQRLLEGKRGTSRTKIYGQVGDHFMVDGKKYTLILIRELSTNYIIKHLWRIEGANSKEELRKVLKGIFRGHFLPEKLRFHMFI